MDYFFIILVAFRKEHQRRGRSEEVLGLKGDITGLPDAFASSEYPYAELGRFCGEREGSSVF